MHIHLLHNSYRYRKLICCSMMARLYTQSCILIKHKTYTAAISHAQNVPRFAKIDLQLIRHNEYCPELIYLY